MFGLSKEEGALKKREKGEQTNDSEKRCFSPHNSQLSSDSELVRAVYWEAVLSGERKHSERRENDQLGNREVY